MTRTKRQRHLYVALVTATLVTACAGNPSPNLPQTQVAEYGTKVMMAVRTGQETVIALNTSNPQVMTDATTRLILDKILLVNGVAQRLKDALVAYDAATTISFRTQKVEEIRELVAQVITLSNSAFTTSIPGAFGQQLASLGVNIVNAAQAVKAEVEKLR
jgi:hypothetical protein